MSLTGHNRSLMLGAPLAPMRPFAVRHLSP